MLFRSGGHQRQQQCRKAKGHGIDDNAVPVCHAGGAPSRCKSKAKIAGAGSARNTAPDSENRIHDGRTAGYFHQPTGGGNRANLNPNDLG